MSVNIIINIWTEHVHWHPKLRQMQESVLRKTLHVRSWLNTKDTVFWLAQIMMCILTLSKFPHFVEWKVISDGPTNGMLIHQLLIKER